MPESVFYQNAGRRSATLLKKEPATFLEKILWQRCSPVNL